MVDLLDSVNDILVYFAKAKKAHEERGNFERAIDMARHEADLRAFIREYKRMDEMTKPIPLMNGDDLSDLPPELISELTVMKTDELETQIVTVINVAHGAADIDTILILLFRKFKVVQTRRFMQNKLWRMTQKELIHSVSGKKGLYSTQPQEPSESKDDSEELLDLDETADSSDYDADVPF